VRRCPGDDLVAAIVDVRAPPEHVPDSKLAERSTVPLVGQIRPGGFRIGVSGLAHEGHLFDSPLEGAPQRVIGS
jgi:hypothetical protein